MKVADSRKVMKVNNFSDGKKVIKTQIQIKFSGALSAQQTTADNSRQQQTTADNSRQQKSTADNRNLQKSTEDNRRQQESTAAYRR